MGSAQYDVVVVGGGCAGMSAAIGLAKAGFAVVVLEAAAFPGAENWSGCVYFCENLVHPALLGPEAVEGLAWERRLVERGTFLCNGHSLLGMTYRDPSAFQHCYTVLRPIFDHHLAQLAMRAGVVLLNNTTAESLIRDEGRVIGVATNRGPVYADLTFLAEGDASHLVTREGYERSNDPRQQPKFLHGIKQVIDLPPGAVQRNFNLGPDEGAAYEIILRNGNLRGEAVHLNMGGFVYTNRQSLSIGLVLPADHLHEHFGGDPNLLMEWFENLPDVQRWCKGGSRGVFGAKLIRGGGAKDIPRLIDHGLAIGGAASGIGVDLPFPNFTGPATRMGLQLVEAAKAIRRYRGSFTEDELQQHYVEPLQRTRYWQDVEYLRRWPGYVERTRLFFGRNVDLALATAYIWTRPRRWFVTKWINWIKMLLHVAGPGRWREMKGDADHLSRALRVREITGRPALGRVLLDGWVNGLRDLLGRPRKDLPEAGQLRLVYSVAGGSEEPGLPPRSVRRWFRRFTPVLAAAAKQVYTNDETPLQEKFRSATKLLTQQVNIFDLIGAALRGLGALATAAWFLGWERLKRALGGRTPEQKSRGMYPEYLQATRRATDLTPLVAQASLKWEDRLGRLSYETDKRSHIHVLWPKTLEKSREIVKAGLWHVCPAHVYEARESPQGQLQVVVNFENCIKCETCWRVSDLVDWGRNGNHRFVYPVNSPAVTPLLASIQEDRGRPAPPRALDWWAPVITSLTDQLPPRGVNGQDVYELAQLQAVLRRLERKLEEFEEALGQEPRTIDRPRADYLELLARYAQQLGEHLVSQLRHSLLATSSHPGLQATYRQLLTLAGTAVVKISDMVDRVRHRKFSWAAADARQARQHHLQGIRKLLGLFHAPQPIDDPARAWLRAEAWEEETAAATERQARRLDEVFAPYAWRDLDQDPRLTPPQETLLQELIAEIPSLEPNKGDEPIHPPPRKQLLAELGRRDPSLAFRVAAHLWARDLGRLFMPRSSHDREVQTWTSFGVVDRGRVEDGRCFGEALFVPAAESIVVLLGNHLVRLSRDTPGLSCQLEATLGLRGAGLLRVALEGAPLLEDAVTVDRDEVLRAWHILSAADLTSIAFGMGDQLTRRSVAHANSRVQFPGLFHDEQSLDTIGKFGAVKKMIAEMGTRWHLIETLDHNLSPADLSEASAERAALVKALVAEALGSASGSLSYNAGQVFGGTGFSEDDILSKFYRDAAAWRFLGKENVHIWQDHGQQLLASWHPDGRRLAALEDEAELFDQVAQRKALQAELDELRVMRTRLRTLAGTFTSDAHSPTHQARVAEALARQDANLLASKALLLRTHARLDAGLHSEEQLAWLRVWLNHVAYELEEFKELLGREKTLKTHRSGSFTEPESEGEVATDYDRYLNTPAEYNSGDFLCTPVNLLQPRLLPEFIETDPRLVETNRHYRDLLANYFGRPRDGLLYERYIERHHGPDAEDLDFCRKNGLLAMMIPKPLGGEGRRKADYYLLITHLQRLADMSLSLLIQVNTSIGTTPIVLARDKDLPKARKHLAPFVGDTSLQREVQHGLERLLKRVGRADVKRLPRAYSELNKRLEEAVFSRTVLKTLAHRFAEAWRQAGRMGREFDAAAFRVRLQDALEAWRDTCHRAPELLEELARRQEACDLFLSWIAHGQISAFALTEPSAGSDTARVATRAKLRSVPVTVEPEGVLRFVPEDRKEPRYLLDARRLVFQPDGVYYRWSDQAEPSRIHFDEYDYETDDPRRQRCYDHGNRRVYFTDIAQLRERDGRLWYDYWELTGAKMWITNGRMMGVMCLYAKTTEGVTGFLVDRHAEGLMVGKDEAKMGQCGSPTNELSLQSVRVPRENVLGLEGRGQVNALETLNVGRAGLAVSANAQMQGLVAMCRAYASSLFGEESLPPWVQWRLDRMQEDAFITESLAFETVGRFEHPQTKSVRMESAIAKMFVSEMLHATIERAEEIHGLAGQTQRYLVEKRKRDARVLNIYEGTNEIQRFFILRDLVTEIAPRYQNSPSEAATPLAQELQSLLSDFRNRLDAGVQTFGQGLAQNPNLQANCFLLSEAAAWLKATESVAARIVWLERTDAEANHAKVARRAVARCGSEVRLRLRRFDEELNRLRRGYYAAEVRAASLMLDQAASPAVPAVAPRSQINKLLSILVVLEPAADASPQPHVHDGRLLEPHYALTDADRAALETALRMRDQGGEQVTVTVATVGGRQLVPLLREVLALGLNRAVLVLSPVEAQSPSQAAEALGRTLRRRGERFDLLIGPAGNADSEDGLLAPLTARLLELPWVGTGSGLAVQHTVDEGTLLLAAEGSRARIRSLPAAVAIEPGIALRSFTTEGYFRELARSVELERWPRGLPSQETHFLPAAQATAKEAETPPHSLQPPEAADLLRAQLGIDTDVLAPAATNGAWHIDEVEYPSDLEDCAAVAVVAADVEGRLSASALAALQAANGIEGKSSVLLLAPRDEERQQRSIAALVEAGVRNLVLLPLDHTFLASPEVRARFLVESWPTLADPPALVVGEPWTELAFPELRLKTERPGELAPRIKHLTLDGNRLRIEAVRAKGRLRTVRTLDLADGQTHWLSFTDDAALSPSRKSPDQRLPVTKTEIQRWSPRLDRFFGQHDLQRLLVELKEETGLVRLADAEFIIDVGYGVGNRDGYEEIIVPLEQALKELGVRGLMIGGSRKVTEELHLLPVDRQIGQSGVSVNPRILLAIGISGAPQHLSYIGPRATIISFNRDPEAPIMTLNQRQPRPRVFPVVGDLFETVPALIAALRTESAKEQQAHGLQSVGLG